MKKGRKKGCLKRLHEHNEQALELRKEKRKYSREKQAEAMVKALNEK